MRRSENKIRKMVEFELVHEMNFPFHFMSALKLYRLSYHACLILNVSRGNDSINVRREVRMENH